MRSVAVGGDITNSVIVTGDDVTIELRVDGQDALLATLLRDSGVPTKALRPLPLDGLAPASAQHVDRTAEAAKVRAAVGAGRSFDISGAREIGKTFVVRDALAGGGGMPDGSVYVFAKGKRYGDVLQELHEAFFACSPPAVVGEQQIRSDLAGRAALVVLDAVELERDELRRLVTLLPGCHVVLVARERALGEGARLDVHGLATPDALELVAQELGRELEASERPAAEQVCALLGGHPYELRQAAAGVRDGERSFAQLARALSESGAGSGGAAEGGTEPSNRRLLVDLGDGERSPSPGDEPRVRPDDGGGSPAQPGDEPRARPGTAAESALARLLLEGLTGPEAAIVAQLAALRGATVGAEHLAGLAGASDLTPTLRALEAARLIASASPRYRIAGVLHGHGSEDSAAIPAMTAYFTRWAAGSRARPETVLREAPALLELVVRAAADKRDADVIALVRASDAAFAWGRRWQTWGDLLADVLARAERSGDDSGRAWALHQIGTRAYCLGDAGLAVASLQQALRLRERLGERGPSAATQHNLDFIAAPPVADEHGRDAGGDGPRPGLFGGRPLVLVMAVAALLVALGAAVAIGLGGAGNAPSPAPSTSVVTTAPPPSATTSSVPTRTQQQSNPPVAPQPPPPPVPPRTTTTTTATSTTTEPAATTLTANCPEAAQYPGTLSFDGTLAGPPAGSTVVVTFTGPTPVTHVGQPRVETVPADTGGSGAWKASIPLDSRDDLGEWTLAASYRGSSAYGASESTPCQVRVETG